MNIDLHLEHVAPPPRNKDYRIGAIGAGFIMRDVQLVEASTCARAASDWTGRPSPLRRRTELSELRPTTSRSQAPRAWARSDTWPG